MTEIDAGAIASNMSSPEASAPVEEGEAVAAAPEAPEGGQEQEAAAPPEEPAKPEVDPDFVRRFNALARKEREIRDREQQFKTKYGEIESYQKEREKVKEDPMGFLEQNGWSFKDLADYVLNNNKPTADQQVSKLQQRIDQLEAERKKEVEDRQKNEELQKNQQTLTEFKANLKKEICADNEQFELINHFGEYDTVYDVINNYYNANGVILDVKKAAAEVEKYLESQFEKAASTNKFKQKFAQQFASEPQEEKEALKPNSGAPFAEPSTLTNEVVSHSSPGQAEPQAYLSDEESKARAAEVLREYMLRKKGYTKNS